MNVKWLINFKFLLFYYNSITFMSRLQLFIWIIICANRLGMVFWEVERCWLLFYQVRKGIKITIFGWHLLKFCFLWSCWKPLHILYSIQLMYPYIREYVLPEYKQPSFLVIIFFDIKTSETRVVYGLIINSVKLAMFYSYLPLIQSLIKIINSW